MSELRSIIFGGKKTKFAKDFTFEGEINVPTGYSSVREFVYAKVKVIPAARQGVPRIFILNKNNNKWVPAGRTAQAKFC